MPESFEELIHQLAYQREGGFDGDWTPDELYGVLIRAAKLDTPALADITRQVGIHFQGGDPDKEEYLLVLEEADDKEKLKNLLRENGV